MNLLIVNAKKFAHLFIIGKSQATRSKVNVLAVGEPVLNQEVSGRILSVVSCGHFIAPVEKVMRERTNVSKCNILPFLHFIVFVVSKEGVENSYE